LVFISAAKSAAFVVNRETIILVKYLTIFVIYYIIKIDKNQKLTSFSIKNIPVFA
jgi:hypothetical protein